MYSRWERWPARSGNIAPRSASGLLCADVRIGLFGYSELPLQRCHTRLRGVGFPDQVGDALVSLVVRIHAHAGRRLAGLDENADCRRAQVQERRRGAITP